MGDSAQVLKWSPLEHDTLACVSVRSGLSIYSSRQIKVKNASSPLGLCCLDYSPAHPGLIASGTESGQLVLFENGTKRETLSAQIERAIKFVAWDSAGDGKVAVGFQASRSEPGISIIDTVALQNNDSGGGQGRIEMHNVYFNEGAYEGAFLRPQVLIAGMQRGNLRIVDFRSLEHLSTNQSVVAHPWGPVRGVRLYRSQYIATFGSTGGRGIASTTSSSESESSSSCLKIWDVRRFDKPVTVLTVSKGQLAGNLSQVEWDPVRPMVLHYIHGTESLIRNIHVTDGGLNEDGFVHKCGRGTPNVVESMAIKSGSGLFAVSSPSESRIEFLASKRPVVSSFLRSEPRLIEIQTNPREQQLLHETVLNEDPMISLVKNGYGADPNLNARLTSGGLRRVWEWIAGGGNKLFVDPTSVPSRRISIVFPSFSSPSRQQTIRLCGWGGGHLPKEGDWQTIVALCILDLRDLKRAVSYLTTMSNSNRTQQEEYLSLAIAAALAGWPGISDVEEPQPPPPVISVPSVPPVQSGMTSPSPVTTEGITRSPSRLALEADDEFLSRANIWCDSVSELEKKVSPLLKVALGLMIACTAPSRGKPEDFIARVVLSQNSSESPFSSLSLTDKLALACTYASDETLKTLMDREIRNAIDSGDLEGLIFTGLTGTLAKSIFQACLERPLTINHCHVALLSAMSLDDSGGVHPILELFRDWLDAANLSVYRAKLDVGLGQARATSSNSQGLSTTTGGGSAFRRSAGSKETVHVHCAKCGANLIVAAGMEQSNSNASTGSSTVNPKSSTASPSAMAMKKYPKRMCANCARLLPVCSICRSPMEWPSPFEKQKHHHRHHDLPLNGVENPLAKRSEFRSWLSWCLECKHGGHVGCIEDWFKIKRVCPVSSCSCTKCAQGFQD